MPVYGYSNGVVNEYGLHEMKEVTFDVPLSDLRKIAAFLIECADLAESRQWRGDHRHLQAASPPWNDCDVIVIHPNPDPPKLVATADS